jgi:formate dehydrogenase major subunit
MGASNLGLVSGQFDELAKDLEAGVIKTLYVVERDLTKVFGDRALALMAKANITILQGPNKYVFGDSVNYRLPTTAYVEEDGHFTNFEGKVQPYLKALAPIGDSRPDYAIFALIQKAIEHPAPKAVAA